MALESSSALQHTHAGAVSCRFCSGGDSSTSSSTNSKLSCSCAVAAVLPRTEDAQFVFERRYGMTMLVVFPYCTEHRPLFLRPGLVLMSS